MAIMTLAMVLEHQKQQKPKKGHVKEPSVVKKYIGQKNRRIHIVHNIFYTIAMYLSYNI